MELLERICWVLQVIPHNFGQKRPPVIAASKAVDAKYEMLNVLNDIAIAQDLQEHQAERETSASQPNPAEENYDSLQADLQLVGREDPAHDLITCFVMVRSILHPSCWCMLGCRQEIFACCQ